MRTAVCFGQNAVNQDKYDGWAGILSGPVGDARDLAVLFSNSGFDSRALFSGWNVDGQHLPWVMSSQCTMEAWFKVHEELQVAANAGDIVVLCNSGHGTQYSSALQWVAGEAMCFWDGTITDKEMVKLYAGWKPGVCVAYVLDTCFSGGMEKVKRSDSKSAPYCVREWQVQEEGMTESEKSGSSIVANIAIYSACADNETAQDGPQNGAYTSTLLNVWDLSKQDLTFLEWHNRTRLVMSTHFPTQHPQLKTYGSTDWLQRRVIA